VKSAPPTATPLWARLGFGVGLLAFVAFPWCFALVPTEVRDEYLLPMLLAAAVQLVAIVYTAIFVTILVHEAGHWIFGRLVGIRISEFVVGTGSAPFRFTWRGIRFSFGPALRWGYVRQIPARATRRFNRQLVFLAGGMALQAIFLGALLALPTPELPHESFGYVLDRLRWYLLLSGFIGIWASIWPRLASIENRLTPNDALLIRQAWQNRGKEDEIWQKIEWVEEINALARAGKYAEAAQLLERRLESDPRNFDWLTGLAGLYRAAKNWDRAVHAHYEIIKITEPGTARYVQAVDNAATLALLLGRADQLVRLRPLLEAVVQATPSATLFGTLGSLLIELGEIEAGVKLLNRCVAETEADHDRAIGNAYLAKAAWRLGRPQRARELLGFAQGKGGKHELVQRLVRELEPELQRTGIAGESPSPSP
jgi:tetratricopeptide (TPR) repeat protein